MPFGKGKTEQRERDEALQERDKLAKQLLETEEAKAKALEELEIIKEDRVQDRKAKEKEIGKLREKTTRLQEDKDILNRKLESLVSDNNEREAKEKRQKAFGWGNDSEMKWNREEASRMRKFLLKSHLDMEGNEISMKFLVFGPTGHGKSSFCNGCRSAIMDTDTPSTYHQVAHSNSTFTDGFHPASYGKNWIIDMAGAYETMKIKSENLEAIAAGKIPFNEEISSTFDVRNKETKHWPESGENDVSCIIFVIKYDMELGPELKRQFSVLMEQAGKGVVSYHLVLTCLDKCDPQFNNPENLKDIYKSVKVQAAVESMAKQTGIPPFAISFVKNYTTELKTNLNTTLQHLHVLERIFHSGLDQVAKRIDKKRIIKAKPKPHVEETKPTQVTVGENVKEGAEMEGLEGKKMEYIFSCLMTKDTAMKTSLFVLLIAVIFMFFVW